MTPIPSWPLEIKNLRIAPDVAPCPLCGALSPRNEVRPLHRQAASLTGPSTICVEVGCYLCPNCPTGSRWFRLAPVGFVEQSDYTDSSRALVLSLVTKYKQSFSGAAAQARDLFHLQDLADTTVMRWFREEGSAVDCIGHMARCVAAFSGQMAIDEVYDGNCYVIRVTDPINRLEIYTWLGKGSPTEVEVRNVLLELRKNGFSPKLVVTDGSPLYPAVLAEVFPEAEHQRCVFHFMQGVNKALNKAFWEAYNEMPQPKKRPRGRPKKKGRPREDNRKKENLKAVRKCHWLLFKRGGLDDKGRPRFSEQERQELEEGMRLCPALRELRRLVDAFHELIGSTTTTHALAEERRQAILADAGFKALAGTESVRRQLADNDLFGRLTRYLDFENADSTSNHPERENREFRKRQGSHYKLRTRPSMLAFLDLMTVRRPVPEEPRRLVRRQPTGAVAAAKEVLAA